MSCRFTDILRMTRHLPQGFALDSAPLDCRGSGGQSRDCSPSLSSYSFASLVDSARPLQDHQKLSSQSDRSVQRESYKGIEGISFINTYFGERVCDRVNELGNKRGGASQTLKVKKSEKKGII